MRREHPRVQPSRSLPPLDRVPPVDGDIFYAAAALAHGGLLDQEKLLAIPGECLLLPAIGDGTSSPEAMQSPFGLVPPGRHDLRYSVVKNNNPIVQAVRSVSSPDGRVRGAFSNGTYVDEAYILRPAA